MIASWSCGVSASWSRGVSARGLESSKITRRLSPCRGRYSSEQPDQMLSAGATAVSELWTVPCS